MDASEIQVRDPFILPVAETGEYFLFGSTDRDVWHGPGTGFDCYRSRDLVAWDGPTPAFRPPADFWATTNFWAPEVHRHAGRFFMFATFFAPGRYRGTQVLAADVPEGPYLPWSDGPVTPPRWQCLDGTLHVDTNGVPWIVFCHEWEQIHNGAVCAQRLTPDLRRAVGRPVVLFNASEAPWVHPLQIDVTAGRAFPVYVTDGPFLHRTAWGALLMLWSSFGARGYAMGLARSENGRVDGEWTQLPEPLWDHDGGHGMIFRTLGGRPWLTFHWPNVTPTERAVFRELIEEKDTLRLA